MFGLPLLPRNLEASVRDLSSAKAETRMAAAKDLVRHARGDGGVRERAIPLLVKALADAHAGVRAEAAIGLGDLQAEEGVSALVIATSDDNAHVCQMAINALGEIGDPRALARLRCALKDRRPEIRYQSVIALPRIVDRSKSTDTSEVDDALFGAAADEDEAVAHMALRVAEERLDSGRPLDARLLARARALVEPRSTTGSRGGSQKPRETEAKSPSAHVVLAAAILLAKAGEDRGYDVIRRVVRGEKIAGQTPDKEDERAAVELAGEIEMKDLARDLERRAWGALRFVRDTCSFHARIALARMGHDRARSEILNELRTSRGDALAGAVVAAGRAKMHEARDTIARLPASVVDPELRREALAALEQAERLSVDDSASPA